MNIKEKLQGYSYALEYAKELEERIHEVRDSMTSINSMRYDDIKASSGINDKIGNAVAKLIEIEHAYLDKICQIAELEIEINKAISTLTLKEQKLIRLRYIQCASWRDIADTMHYSHQGIHKLHGNILEKLENSRQK